MEAKVSFFVKGINPYKGLNKLLLENGVLNNVSGVRQCIVSERRLDAITYLFQLSLTDLQRLQVQQGIPFQGFKGEPAKALEPKSVLVVSKDSREPAHLETMASVEITLRVLGIRYRIVSSRELKPDHFKNRDAVMPVGGDGTFLGTAHLTKSDVPFIGVVSDPQSVKSNPLGSWGHYMLLSATEIEQAFNLLARGEFQVVALTRLIAFLRHNSKNITTQPGLNELFINEQDSAHAARYLLRVCGISEYMSDSGVLISTGSGSSANGWISNALGLTFSPTSGLLQFKLREPARFLPDGSERDLLHGFAEEIEA